MFDQLVESTKQRTGRRTGRFLAITSIVYTVGIVIICVGTIVTFSPVLAEEYILIAPLVPIRADRQQEVLQHQEQNFVEQPQVGFVTPKGEIEIPPADKVPEGLTLIPSVNPRIDVGRNPDGDDFGSGTTRLGNPEPPPAPKPTPKPDPTPAPTPERQQTKKVSEGVLQGIAIQRVKPSYPQIARSTRTSGQVQIQVTISEEGRVIEATVLDGPPLLRAAAREAALKWVFSPTMLSNVPVRVQGVLTFNFTLE